jgi:endoglucanase
MNLPDKIKVNQLGFLPNAPKMAVVANTGATSFALVNAQGSTVFNGNLSAAAEWAPSGETVRKADFSAFTTPGTYRVKVAGLADSNSFAIGEDVYDDLHDAAVKAYYFNRASTALTAEYAGVWARPAGHPDTNVQVHSSAATATRPAGTVISAPKGWYDAGDYNKYIVNAGISTYTLLAAYEHFPDFYQGRNVNIPESSNNVPDLLDEIMWNLEWMEKMQDTDGGVYHKLTTANFSGEDMPHETTAQRYVVQKGTGATLNFAAVMAVASRVFADYQSQFPGKSAAYAAAAEKAWTWAKANPNVRYRQPTDIRTGEYGDATFADEFAWAAAELFLQTGQQSYLAEFFANTEEPGVPWWGGVAALGYISLATHGEGQMGATDYARVTDALVNTGSYLRGIANTSAYGVTMTATDFVWGSNSGGMNQAMMLLQAYRVTGDASYYNAAYQMLDYVLGRNATDYSFVTGFGSKSPMDIHHRQSVADDVEAPVPGFLVGGPHSGQQDECPGYPSNLPAKSYVDSWCSYATNEVTINWNAPLVYVTAALLNP